MRKGFAALLLCGPIVLSGCAETETQNAEPTSLKQESPTSLATSSPEPSPIPASKLQDCEFKGEKLGGRVYFTDYQYEFGNKAITVYEKGSVLYSDLSVYMASDASLPTRQCGVWQVASSPFMADLTIYISDTPLNADLTIYYVSDPFYAGLR